MGKLILIMFAILIAVQSAYALEGFEIKPKAPPGLAEKIEMFFGWIYWLAVVSSAVGVVAGAVMIWAGKDNGRQLLFGALLALAILASLPALLSALGI